LPVFFGAFLFSSVMTLSLKSIEAAE
jgi:hypothetical protein